MEVRWVGLHHRELVLNGSSHGGWVHELQAGKMRTAGRKARKIFLFDKRVLIERKYRVEPTKERGEGVSGIRDGGECKLPLHVGAAHHIEDPRQDAGQGLASLHVRSVGRALQPSQNSLEPTTSRLVGLIEHVTGSLVEFAGTQEVVEDLGSEQAAPVLAEAGTRQK